MVSQNEVIEYAETATRSVMSAKGLCYTAEDEAIVAAVAITILHFLTTEVIR